MERFKLNDKEYYVEVKNNHECIITEFGNKANQFVMDANELRELLVKFKKPYAFGSKEIINCAITEINVSAITETSVILDIKQKEFVTSPPAKIPLRDFCRELLAVFLDDKKPNEVSDNMQCVDVAIKVWKANSDILFMDRNCGILDDQGDVVGVGYFEEDKLMAVSNCNLSLFSKLYLVLPKNGVTVELINDEQITNTLARYTIKHQGLKACNITSAKRDAIATFDIKDPSMHAKICDFFKFKEVGKAKSNLDNFFDI